MYGQSELPKGTNLTLRERLQRQRNEVIRHQPEWLGEQDVVELMGEPHYRLRGLEELLDARC